MADNCGSSSTASSVVNERAVLVRVKRKSFQAPLEALWLEINERPLKRPLLDFGKLSISESTIKEELKCKRVFVQHVETVRNSEVTFDILQSKVQPYLADEFDSNTRSDEQRRVCRNGIQKQSQLSSKSREKHEVLATNARFEQIWKSRKGDIKGLHGKALHEMWDLYDVVRLDDEEKSKKKKAEKNIDMSLEDQTILRKFLPLMREHIPSAAKAIESDIHDYMTCQEADEYVYDLYTGKGDMDIADEDPSNTFPLVQVDDNDDFYNGAPKSEYESEDSNDEDNPRNDYPDEMSESGSKTSDESGSEKGCRGASRGSDSDSEVAEVSFEGDVDAFDDRSYDGSDYDNEFSDTY